MSLDHGWYMTPDGERVDAPRLYPGAFHEPYLSVLCEPCATGWVEEVRWRAEPDVLALAERRQRAGAASAPLLRWALVTSMLAELLDGMPVACSGDQRDRVRRGEQVPRTHVWCCSTSQRRPARVHLSQVPIGRPGEALVQIVALDIAHLTVVAVLASDERAERVVAESGLTGDLASAA